MFFIILQIVAISVACWLFAKATSSPSYRYNEATGEYDRI